jgi:GNAT superfamily N-acetyltransferase
MRPRSGGSRTGAAVGTRMQELRPMTATSPSADVAASALASTWALLAATLQRGWAREVGQAIAVVTGVPLPALNGVWATRSDTSADDMHAGLEAVAASGLPHCLQARPGCCAAAAAVAERRGLVADPDIPLMATAARVDGPRPEGLMVRELEPAEASLHCEVAGPAFGAPPELLAGLITPVVLRLPEVRGYVGEVGGQPVVTAMSVTLEHAVGIFNVATLRAYRRRGYGAALTARALRDGLEHGASWGWLQSTEAGHGVYESLGFVTLERWPCWVTPS